jgi:hypothetical protein
METISIKIAEVVRRFELFINVGDYPVCLQVYLIVLNQCTPKLNIITGSQCKSQN